MKSLYVALAALAMISGTAVAQEKIQSTSSEIGVTNLLARDGAGGANGSERTPGAIRSEELREKQIKTELEKQKAREQAQA